MVYYIYKVTNLTNNKYYIGKRQYDGLIENDIYLGSGKLIKMAIKKYGRKSFSKDILHICSTLEELNLREKEIITEEIINDIMSYNLALGGGGGNLGTLVNLKIKMICESPEYRARMSEIINRPEVKGKMIDAIKKTMADEEWKANFSKKQKEVQNLPHNRKRNSEKQKIAQNKPENILKRRLAMNELYLNDEFKNKHLNACNTEHFRKCQRNKVLGKKWVHNKILIKQKYVTPEMINTFLKDGWELGMLPQEKNISRLVNKNEKYKDIIPIIITKYREGLLISEIKTIVGISEALVSELIKKNMSDEEIKKIKSVNLKRR